MGVVDKLNLSPIDAQCMLEFFRHVLPDENKLPQTFYKINKNIYKSKVTEIRLCNVCEKTLNSKRKCPSTTCVSNTSLYSFKPIKIFILNIKNQITFILDNHYDSILSNLAHVKKDGYVYDITSGWKYKYNQNYLNLILFADGVNYNKSSSKTIWALLSAIAELPQKLRESHENKIAHSMWSGSNPDFNVFLEQYNKPTTELIENGLYYKGRTIRFNIHMLVADSPARSKVCKSVQFNGKYGCLTCMHPTSRLGHTTIYEYQTNVKIRTESDYENQVEQTFENEEPCLGIKGESFLSVWTSIPEHITIDYMHGS
jgi:hypothetical protein